MKRRPLGLSSPASCRLRTATGRGARTLEMHIGYQPAAAARAHHVDRLHVVAIRALQLYTIRPQLGVSRDEQRAFDDAVSGVIEVFLNHGDALPQHTIIHVVGRRTALRTPQLPHFLQIVRFDRGEELRERLVHRLRNRRPGTRIPAAGRSSENQEDSKREPWLHETVPVVKVTRR